MKYIDLLLKNNKDRPVQIIEHTNKIAWYFSSNNFFIHFVTMKGTWQRNPWKARLSIHPEDFEKAWEIVSPVLFDHGQNFKVAHGDQVKQFVEKREEKRMTLVEEYAAFKKTPLTSAALKEYYYKVCAQANHEHFKNQGIKGSILHFFQRIRDSIYFLTHNEEEISSYVNGAYKKLIRQAETGVHNARRFQDGMQFTVYIQPEEEKNCQRVLKTIEEKLVAEEIRPGAVFPTDRKIGLYSSVRHEGVSYQKATQVKNYNPDNAADPFEDFSEEISVQKPATSAHEKPPAKLEPFRRSSSTDSFFSANATRLPFSHDLLLNVCIALKWRKPDALGVCNGYALMLTQFFLQNKQPLFFSLIKELKKYHNERDIVSALSSPKTSPVITALKRLLQDISHHQNLLTEAEIFEAGSNYVSVLTEKLSGQTASENALLLQYHPLSAAYYSVFLLNQNELIHFLTAIKDHLEKVADMPLSITIGNNNHIFVIRYDMERKQWLNWDVALIETDGFEHHNYTTSELATSIFTGLFDSDAEYTGGEISILCHRDNLLRAHSALSSIGKALPSLAAMSSRVNANGHSLLQMFISLGRDEVTAALALLATDNLSQLYVDGESLLHKSIRVKAPRSIKALLSNPAVLLDEYDAEGYTPLIRACMIGDEGCVHLLLDSKRLNPDLKDKTETGRSALHWACFFGFTPIVSQLINHPGVNANSYDNEGYTPLMIACVSGNIEIVTALLAGELDVNLKERTESGNSALHLAIYLNFTPIVEALISHPAIDLNIPANNGLTPLDIAATSETEEIRNLLADRQPLQPSLR